jgi:hypothetical protein
MVWSMCADVTLVCKGKLNCKCEVILTLSCCFCKLQGFIGFTCDLGMGL